MRKTAKEMGLVVGQNYIVDGVTGWEDGGEAPVVQGDVVTFIRDDDSVCPKFKILRTGRETFIEAQCMKPIAQSTVKFEEQEVKSVITTITIPRALTEAERDAIRKIVGV